MMLLFNVVCPSYYEAKPVILILYLEDYDTPVPGLIDINIVTVIDGLNFTMYTDGYSEIDAVGLYGRPASVLKGTYLIS